MAGFWESLSLVFVLDDYHLRQPLAARVPPCGVRAVIIVVAIEAVRLTVHLLIEGLSVCPLTTLRLIHHARFVKDEPDSLIFINRIKITIGWSLKDFAVCVVARAVTWTIP